MLTREEAIERIGDRTVIASLSGGKDSTAMALHLQEWGIPFRAVFLDTGWEHPDTYRYLREYLPGALGVEIEWHRAEIDTPPELEDAARLLEKRLGIEYSGMIRLVLRKGAFPHRVMRFCTQQLKAAVIRELLSDDCVNAVGIRWGESKARARMVEWEDVSYYGCEVWRPLLPWTLDDVIAIHDRRGVLPNPLYLTGADRVGCWPCIYARKSEIRHLGDTDAARVSVIRDLEALTQCLARARYAERGETFASLGHDPPTWFSRAIGAPTRMVSIDEAIEWAHTSRGGRQFEMFAPSSEDTGCMRWGLCDAGSPFDEEDEP